MKEHKILLLDIETSPIIGYTWGLYEQNVIKRIKSFTILSVAYKWLGEKEVFVIACDSLSERQLLVKLRSLMDEAEIIIAHNGDSFDIKKINARMIVHRIPPYSPIRTIDTKLEAKKIAAFDSNSLNNLGIDLSEGEKIEHRGFPMWEGCLKGNQKDWDSMKSYNKGDVELLEDIYYRLRPWMKSHPVVSHGVNCPKCGLDHLRRAGSRITGTMVYQRYQCKGCGGYARATKGERNSEVISQ